MTTTAQYLLERLAQLGVTTIFGLPGDFNLAFVSAIDAHPTVKWMYVVSATPAGLSSWSQRLRERNERCHGGRRLRSNSQRPRSCGFDLWRRRPYGSEWHCECFLREGRFDPHSGLASDRGAGKDREHPPSLVG
jgi:hypothetical protein